MNERILQLRIGMMVLATLIITATLLVLFGETPRFFKRKIDVTITFPEAPNVHENTPVRRRGVLIGNVTDLEFVRDGGVRVTAEIEDDKRPFTNEVCWITPSLMGDSNVNFARPEREALSGQLVEDGATITGRVAADPVHAVGDLQRNLSGALESVVKTSDDASQMMIGLRDMFQNNEERIQKIVETAEANMGLINTTLMSVNEILDAEAREDIKKAVSDMPELLDQTRQMFAQMRHTMDNADDRLTEISAFTQELGKRGPDVIARLDDGADNLSTAMAEIATFSQTLNRSDGSLGMMLRDKELYNNLSQAAANIEELTRQLRPIINDARVFSDKIARHPELLGVRGAMQRNAGTKGVPSFPPLR